MPCSRGHPFLRPPSPLQGHATPMDTRSAALLAQVHPDLVKVICMAAQAPQPFEVTYGVRSLAAEAAAVASGHSQTMHSRHLPDRGYATDRYPEGLACAVDLTPLIGGVLSFAPGQEAHTYGAIAVQVLAAAHALKVPLEWGGDWRTFKDWGHFQLPWRDYP